MFSDPIKEQRRIESALKVDGPSQDLQPSNIAATYSLKNIGKRGPHPPVSYYSDSPSVKQIDHNSSFTAYAAKPMDEVFLCRDHDSLHNEGKLLAVWWRVRRNEHGRLTSTPDPLTIIHEEMILLDIREPLTMGGYLCTRAYLHLTRQNCHKSAEMSMDTGGFLPASDSRQHQEMTQSRLELPNRD